jgi:hypothetical protein
MSNKLETWWRNISTIKKFYEVTVYECTDDIVDHVSQGMPPSVQASNCSQG